MEEFWLLEALDRCHDVLWPTAEKGDGPLGFTRHEAEVLMRRNPGKFKRVGIFVEPDCPGKSWKKKVDFDED